MERTEVVTGGASAAYGSDAIAGVVNLILNKNLEGFRAQADYGETGEGDGGDTHASFAYGTAFADDERGHVIFGVEYQQQDTIGPCSQNRDWCKEAWGIQNNAPAHTTGNGNPNFIVTPGAKQIGSENGIISPCTNAGCTTTSAPLTFNPDGTTLSPFNPGLPATAS